MGRLWRQYEGTDNFPSQRMSRHQRAGLIQSRSWSGNFSFCQLCPCRSTDSKKHKKSLSVFSSLNKNWVWVWVWVWVSDEDGWTEPFLFEFYWRSHAQLSLCYDMRIYYLVCGWYVQNKLTTHRRQQHRINVIIICIPKALSGKALTSPCQHRSHIYKLLRTHTFIIMPNTERSQTLRVSRSRSRSRSLTHSAHVFLPTVEKHTLCPCIRFSTHNNFGKQTLPARSTC